MFGLKEIINTNVMTAFVDVGITLLLFMAGMEVDIPGLIKGASDGQAHQGACNLRFLAVPSPPELDVGFVLPLVRICPSNQMPRGPRASAYRRRARGEGTQGRR